MPPITYAVEPDLSVNEFIDILKRSTLSERRPVDQPERCQQMLDGSDVMITARTADGVLAGISRAITDFAYCTYLSDLAVDVNFQNQGIGKQLIEHTHQAAGKHTTLILLAAPKAKTYYPHIGMTPHDSCWITPASTD